MEDITLAHPDLEKIFEIYSDASNFQLGLVRSQ